MGNNITGLNPVLGVTVEQVLVEFKDWHHVHVLGNSRFFKVSKVRDKEGNYEVLKVFKYLEGIKNLVEKYNFIIQSYCFHNSSLTNILPYTRCLIVKDTVCLWRKFVQYSLSERLSVRPFLRLEEKKWIAFQILCGLTQCHKERLLEHYSDNLKLCHGDLKMENIVLTDWGWVFLTDMAPFKPVYMPDNNPGEFYFFFDVMNKRACNVAPERFISVKIDNIQYSDEQSTIRSSQKTQSVERESVDSSATVMRENFDFSDQTKYKLQPSMDMFSTGCIFIELFTDGVVPFTLADLFNYRDKKLTKLDQLLKKIGDENIKNLIQRLLDLNPETRITAEDCLVSQRGKMFPDIFYRELKGYMVQFMNESLTNPEIRVNKLYSDFSYILQTYVAHKTGRHVSNGILILFVNLITSVMFLVHEEQNKIRCLVMLKELGLYMTDDLALERVVPFLLEFVDPVQSVEVRRTALDCAYLSVVDTSPTNLTDLSFFPDYYLPAIMCLQKDRSIFIQYSFTRQIHGLARTSCKYLQECMKLQKRCRKTNSDNTKINYDEELQRLRDIFREMIINLFSSEQNVGVKCCITERECLSDMTEFFSLNRARDDLLSHLITFLNDKTNYIARLCFYEAMPDVLEIMGAQSALILEALLIQGLQDGSLRVIEACCRSLARACRNRTIPDRLRSLVLPDIFRLFALPHAALRLVALDYIISFSAATPFLTVFSSFIRADQCGCIIKKKSPFGIQRNTETVLWNSLHSPISRCIFEDVLRHSEISEFLNFLWCKHKSGQSNSNVLFKSGNIAVDILYERLKQQEMTVNNEHQLIVLSGLLRNLVASKNLKNTGFGNNNNDSGTATSSGGGGGAELRIKRGPTNMRDLVPEAVAYVNLESSIKYDTGFNGKNSDMGDWSSSGDQYSQNAVHKWAAQGVQNSAWENLFDKDVSQEDENKLSSTDIKLNILNTSLVDRQKNASSTSLLTCDDLEWSFRIGDENKFKMSVTRGLVSGATHLTSRNHITGRINVDQTCTVFPTAWRPRGILVGHLHEHKRGFTSVVAHPTDKQFISCGAEKTLRFWNCDPNPNRSDPTFSKYIPNKSVQSLQLVNEETNKKVSCLKLVWMEQCNSVAAVVDGKFVNIAERSGDMKKVFEFPSNEYGMINSVSCSVATNSELDSASQRTLVYCTTGGWIVAHDTRCSSPVQSVWSHKQNNDFGLITCCAIHSPYTWMVTGTSRGCLVYWDLRFQRVITKLDHPNTLGFLSVSINPLYSSQQNQTTQTHPNGDVLSMSLEDLSESHVWASTEDENEVSCWNLELGERTVLLQSSPIKKSSDQRSFSRRSRAYIVRLVGSHERRPCVITGSSDCHIRYWDLKQPTTSSSMVSLGGLDQYSGNSTFHYRVGPSYNQAETTRNHGLHRMLIEQNQTIETVNSVDDYANQQQQKRNMQPFTGHVAAISDLTTVSLGQPFILSASMDGVIKIWK